MTTRDDNALTPEERALAQRLARSARRASLRRRSTRASSRRRTRRRPAPADDVAPARVATLRKRKPQTWVTTLGFAASLALACGIAWNLREMPDAPQAASAPVQAPEEEAVEYPPAAAAVDVGARACRVAR